MTSSLKIFTFMPAFKVFILDFNQILFIISNSWDKYQSTLYFYAKTRRIPVNLRCEYSNFVLFQQTHGGRNNKVDDTTSIQTYIRFWGQRIPKLQVFDSWRVMFYLPIVEKAINYSWLNIGLSIDWQKCQRTVFQSCAGKWRVKLLKQWRKCGYFLSTIVSSCNSFPSLISLKMPRG